MAGKRQYYNSVITFQPTYNFPLFILVTYAPYWDHVLPFWKRRNQPNILFLKYEDISKNLPSIIETVASFLERQLTQEQVSSLANHLSFDNMKTNSAVNYEMLVDTRRKYKISDDDGCFMRSGKVGGYKADMTEEIAKKFDDWTEYHTRNTDLSFHS